MPRMDKTGPNGNGPMTGRGLGQCQAGEVGYGIGRRGGFGCRRGFVGNFTDNPVSTLNTKEALIEQKDFLESKIENINMQLEKM